MKLLTLTVTVWYILAVAQRNGLNLAQGLTLSHTAQSPHTELKARAATATSNLPSSAPVTNHQVKSKTTFMSDILERRSIRKKILKLFGKDRGLRRATGGRERGLWRAARDKRAAGSKAPRGGRAHLATQRQLGCIFCTFYKRSLYKRLGAYRDKELFHTS